MGASLDADQSTPKITPRWMRLSSRILNLDIEKTAVRDMLPRSLRANDSFRVLGFTTALDFRFRSFVTFAFVAAASLDPPFSSRAAPSWSFLRFEVYGT